MRDILGYKDALKITETKVKLTRSEKIVKMVTLDNKEEVVTIAQKSVMTTTDER